MQHAAWDGEPTPSGRWRGAAEPGPAFEREVGAPFPAKAGTPTPTDRRSSYRIEVFTRCFATSERVASEAAKWPKPILARVLGIRYATAQHPFGVANGAHPF